MDEIQLIDFNSTKENSFESLLLLTNETKVAFVVIGTEDAYEKMFKGGGDRFAEDSERMLATLFGLPEAKGQSVSTRNNVCPWDLTDVIRRYAKMSRDRRIITVILFRA